MPRRHRFLKVEKEFLQTKVLTLYDEKYLLTRTHAADFLDMSINTFKTEIEGDPAVEAVIGRGGTRRYRVNDLVEWAARQSADRFQRAQA